MQNTQNEQPKRVTPDNRKRGQSHADWIRDLAVENPQLATLEAMLLIADKLDHLWQSQLPDR